MFTMYRRKFTIVMIFILLLTIFQPHKAFPINTYTNKKLFSSYYNKNSMKQLRMSSDVINIIANAGSRAFNGGIAGASASAVQVVTLMWLRTAMNYQYQYGNTTIGALQTLYNEGGVPRLYQGLGFALIQGPLSRFGDTAANSLVIAMLDSFEQGSVIPLSLRTLMGSVAAGGWRVVIMPVDAVKTTLQVRGQSGLDALKARVALEGPSVLYSGSVAAAAATTVGHFPWFFIYNYLSTALPAVSDVIMTSNQLDLHSQSLAVSQPVALLIPTVDWLSRQDPTILDLLRSAFIGLCASSASDVCSNSLRYLQL